MVEVEKFNDYFEGAPNIDKILIKALPDANALQAELTSQIVDLAPGRSKSRAGYISKFETRREFKGRAI